LQSRIPDVSERPEVQDLIAECNTFATFLFDTKFGMAGYASAEELVKGYADGTAGKAGEAGKAGVAVSRPEQRPKKGEGKRQAAETHGNVSTEWSRCSSNKRVLQIRILPCVQCTTLELMCHGGDAACTPCNAMKKQCT